jgi:hypothetical protein
MERIAQAEPGRSRWRREWSVLGLAALTIVVLVVNYRISLWVLADLVAAPLTFLAVPALLLVPGLALLRWLWPHPLRPAERWSLALGISAGLPPLLFLLGEPIGVRWNTGLCWAYLLLAALGLWWPARGSNQVFRSAKVREETRKHDLGARDFAHLRGFLARVPARLNRNRAWDAVVPSVPERKPWEPHELARNVRAALDREHILLIGMTLIALAVQLYVVRDLPVGMYGDSYHHTIIAQLMVDRGGLFSSWRPYAPLATFTYHYGFHSLVAWLYWLSGTPVTRGLLIIGQVEIALTVPLVYVLARRLLGDGRAALWAALLAGFVSAMPAYYVNWGRYTQLGGQTILPAACISWMELLDTIGAPGIDRRRQFRLIVVTSLVTAGLVLTHYRVAVFAACFVVAYGLYVILRDIRSWGRLARIAAVGLSAAALIGLLVLPWLIRLREGRLLLIGNKMITANLGTDQTNALPQASIIALIAKPYMIVLSLVGVGLLAWRRDWRALTLVIWAAVACLVANPYLVGLNGAGIISNFAVLIAAYLLLAPLAGTAIAAAAGFILTIVMPWLDRLAGRSAALSTLAPKRTRTFDDAQIVAGMLLILWAVGWQQHILDTSYQLFTPADRKAMEWIRREIPADAKFLVNSFPAFTSLYAGSDGGWWLPFLTGRQSNLPPITYGTEAGEQPDFVASIKRLNAGIQEHVVASAATASLLHELGFDYLYDGPAANPPSEYINPAALARSPFYTVIYQQQGVTIWKIRIEALPAGSRP